MYKVYQYLVAVPILIAATLFTAILTIICFPWKRALWLHRVQSVWARLFCYLMFIPVSVSGKEHIRKRQSYVFVSNHQSNYDVFLIYGWLPVIFKWLMKKEIRKMPFVGLACSAAGHVYIDRSHARSAQESILAVEKILTNGLSTVIFPEGTRSKDGSIGTFKRGAFQIAMDLNLPVIPISLSGCYEVLPRNAKSITRHPIHMHIGEEINLSRFESTQEAMDYVRNKVIEGCHK